MRLPIEMEGEYTALEILRVNLENLNIGVKFIIFILKLIIFFKISG